MPQNEKGMTLLEVLLAVTISTVLFSSAYMLYFAIQSLWNNSVTSYDLETSVHMLEKAVNDELSAPLQLYYINNSPDAKELQFKTFDGAYKSLYFDMNTKQLSLYTLQNASLPGQIGELEIQFTAAGDLTIKTVNRSGIKTVQTATGFLPDDELVFVSVTVPEIRIKTNGDKLVHDKTFEFPVIVFEQ